MAELVRGARDYVAGKQAMRAGATMTGTRLASSLADDIAKQEKWLTAEAKARGYTDIEDLLEKNYPVFEKLAELWRQKHPADGGVMLSRTASTTAAYEQRIDALFDGGKPGRFGARVLDRTELLGLLGYADKPVILQESKVVQGTKNHPEMTAAIWKKLPNWLDAPAAVFDSDTVDGRLVFVAPELVSGKLALIVVEPDADPAAGLKAHLLVNAYGKDAGAPFARWVNDGLARYVDQNKFPAVLARAGLQLPRKALENKPGTKKILTDKNLVGYIKANQGESDHGTVSRRQHRHRRRARRADPGQEGRHCCAAGRDRQVRHQGDGRRAPDWRAVPPRGLPAGPLHPRADQGRRGGRLNVCAGPCR